MFNPLRKGLLTLLSVSGMKLRPSITYRCSIALWGMEFVSLQKMITIHMCIKNTKSFHQTIIGVSIVVAPALWCQCQTILRIFIIPIMHIPVPFPSLPTMPCIHASLPIMPCIPVRHHYHNALHHYPQGWEHRFLFPPRCGGFPVPPPLACTCYWAPHREGWLWPCWATLSSSKFYFKLL